jgi:hypothetical protein
MKLGAEEVEDADDLPLMADGADFLRLAGHLTTTPPEEDAALRASQQLVHTVLLRFMTEEALPLILWKENDDDLGRDFGDDEARAEETALASSWVTDRMPRIAFALHSTYALKMHAELKAEKRRCIGRHKPTRLTVFWPWTLPSRR